MRSVLLKCVVIISLLSFHEEILAQKPNILIVIADDLGVDYTHGYHQPLLLPHTPHIDSLRTHGVTFKNVFSAPKCTPSRASIMSGKYGIKSDVIGTPGNLSTNHISLFHAIENETNGAYADAVIGKWHISHPADPLHPEMHGVDYYTGLLTAMVDDYFAWQRTENGNTFLETEYATTVLTDKAIEWVAEQNELWILWFAHVAPHAPFHLPPDSLYTIQNPSSKQEKYIAMIESIDHELGRLLNSIPPDELMNTLIIFLGDNGTPNGVLQDYPSGHGKSTIYQGGIRVPFIVSGKGVTRHGEQENAMIHIADIYATLLEFVGAELPGGIYNSLSFKHLLDSAATGKTRDYNYSEIKESQKNRFTIRNTRFKLIEDLDNGSQEFYDLLLDSLETNNLILSGLSDTELLIKEDLEDEANQIRTSWSCKDHIQNGDEMGVDCGGSYCAPCMSSVDEINQNKYSLYPSPVTDVLEINHSHQLRSISFYTMDFKLLAKVNYPSRSIRLDNILKTSGAYIVVLEEKSGHRHFSKLLFQQ